MCKYFGEPLFNPAQGCLSNSSRALEQLGEKAKRQYAFFFFFTLSPLAPGQCLAYIRCSINVCGNNLCYGPHSSEGHGRVGQETPCSLRYGHLTFPSPWNPSVRPPSPSLTSYKPDYSHVSSCGTKFSAGALYPKPPPTP